MPPFSSSEAAGAVDCVVCRSSEESSTSTTSGSSTTETAIPPVIKCPSSRTSSSGDDERCVSFNAVIQVMEVLNKDQYYKSEKINTWYSEQELMRIQRDGLNIIKRLEHHCSWPEDCLRGLECQTLDGFHKVRKNRLLSKFAVLEEQKKLRANPRGRSTLIGGNLYRTISSVCLQDAAKLAEQDAIDAQNYQAEPACTTTLTQRFRELEEGDECEEFKCLFLLDPAKWLSLFMKKPLITD